MRLNIPAVAIAALTGASLSTGTLAFHPSSFSSVGSSSLSTSTLGRPAFVAPKFAPPQKHDIQAASIELHMVGGGKDEEAESNLNEYKKKLSTKRITESSKHSGEVRIDMKRCFEKECCGRGMSLVDKCTNAMCSRQIERIGHRSLAIDRHNLIGWFLLHIRLSGRSPLFFYLLIARVPLSICQLLRVASTHCVSGCCRYGLSWFECLQNASCTI